MTIEEELEAAKKTITDLQGNLKNVNRESEDRRGTIKEQQTTIDGFGGIDMDKYNSALEVADKFGKDKLQHENKVSELRAEIEGEFKSTVEKANKRGDLWNDKYRGIVIDKDLLAAAAKYDAIDPSEAVILMKTSVKMDDEGITTVLDKDGHTRRNDDGSVMGIDTFAKGWLNDRPHHVKSSGGGSGSRGGDGKGGSGDMTSKEKITAGIRKRTGL